MNLARRMAGFTLVELIVVMVLAGIIASFVALTIAQPIEGFIASSRRAALVDEAATALNRITREVRLALPNSVRLSGTTALEFLRTRSGGRYRATIDPAAAVAGLDLDFNAAQDTFEIIGQAKEFGGICAAASGNCGGASPASSADCLAGNGIDCLVIFNTGQPADCAAMPSGRTNAYCGDNVAGIEAFDVAARTLSFVHDRAGGFEFQSPRQRFHVVDTPVSYLCSTATGNLTRYDGYPIAALQPNRLVKNQVRTRWISPGKAGRRLAI